MYSFVRLSLNLLSLFAWASSSPLFKRDNTDIDILQFALTLEHLENAFYKQALSKWSANDFAGANFSSNFYTQLQYIVHDEEEHMVFLEQTIRAAGANPVQACTYNLPFTTPADFVASLATFEGVGTSAYLGAAPLLSSKQYLTAAAAIMSTEAIHEAAARNAIGEIPMANPFATPLSGNAIYSIASKFIQSCPSSNAKLPFHTYPGLNLTQSSPLSVNSSITLASQGSLSNSTQIYVTFVSGLQIISVTGRASGNSVSATVPQQISGQSYVFLTGGNSSNLTDSNILYGPAIIEVTPSNHTYNASSY
ncbi:ferritin-like domain-containing protein LALA0_S12e00276g [Lachancea lanzarotensis]|uniref:LALA0S12e00276g1_1 n=1 Tax=Lachancea lanzarotensis TaxID=1245769 RepID=A0A0C7N309_9SACH|nr:uncharacterized protein LALA0_S12e00276g [Lachancea lanzarotensis]CEP64503.1 LALA0S12e00276g1_1 [Lachancea lanzarotensis]